MNIVFDSIRISSVSGNAGVFVGSNLQLNWQAQTKQNSAQGTVIGEMNLLSHNINVIYDNDQIDMPIRNGAGQGDEEGAKEGKGTD
ncbi:hypothetical protein [Paenibacillus ginsengihumi]|uniref:hypothetical protein n=1 Tax=Paenibacillus ginsengihumi TaxID=431596 RepID=UPI0003658A7E|nr:hypothetical protein [Paenibacillus ginsengihumi]